MNDKKRQTIVKAHCNKCFCDTNHLVVAERIQRDQEKADPNDPEDNVYVEYITAYTMLECRGCESVILRQRFSCSEWPHGEFDEYFYPPQISRRRPEWHKKLPKEIQELLEEVYTALHSDSRMLAMMGIRAIIDIFITEKLGDIGGFSKKLEALVSKGHISRSNEKILNAALHIGHAAAHRGHKADDKTVNQVIDIVENLIQQEYVLKKAADDLKAATPIRKVK